MAQMLKVHDCTAICAPTPAQLAALASLTGPQDVYETFLRTLADRREAIMERLDAMTPGISYVRPGGAFYIMAHYDLPLAPMDVATRLIREAHVITIPGDSFGPGGAQSLRLSFGGDDEEIETACDRLAAWMTQEHQREDIGTSV